MDKRKKILSGAGGIAFVLAAWFLYDHFMYISTDNAQVEAHSLLLAPKVSGFVVAVPVVEGQRVKQGDTLVEIDVRDFQNSQTQAKGELSSLEARRKEADRNYQRVAELYKSGAVSKAQFETASAAFSEAKAKHESALAQLSQAELNVDNAKVRAPFDGYVARKSVEVGQLASAGVPLIGFVDSQERWVIANFKETDIAHIRVGGHVRVDVDAVPGHSFKGEVESISAATGSTFTLLPPDNATGNFTKVVQRVPVKIRLLDLSDSDREQLRAGLSADARVDRH